MNETEATEYVAEWIKRNNFIEHEYFWGKDKARPDFLIDSPRKLMVEVKGSRFSMTELVGQVVYYLLSYEERKLIVAIAGRVEKVEELRTKLRRHRFNFEILDVAKLKFFSEAKGVNKDV